MRLKNFVGFKNNFRVKGKKIASKRIYGYQKKLWKGVKKTLVPNNFWVKKIWVEVICWVKNFPVKVFVWGQKNCLDPKISGKNFWDQKFLFLKNLRSKNVLRLKKNLWSKSFCC